MFLRPSGGPRDPWTPEQCIRVLRLLFYVYGGSLILTGLLGGLLEAIQKAMR